MMLKTRLKLLRKNLSKTQKQVAVGIHISERSYQRLEAGEKPNYDTLLALANYFDVPLDYLLGRGVFENWEEIMEYKDQVIDRLEEAIPELKQIRLPDFPEIRPLSLSKLPDSLFMSVLQILVRRIVFEDGTMKIYLR